MSSVRPLLAARQRPGDGRRRTARCRRSSPGRCAASSAAHRSGAACARPPRGGPPRPGRSRRELLVDGEFAGHPDSVSCRMTSPTSAVRCHAGRAPRRPAPRGAAIARSGRIQLIGPRKSLITTAIPRRRSGRRRASMAAARSPHAQRCPRRGGDRTQQRPARAGDRTGRAPHDGLTVGDHRAQPVSAAAVEIGDRGGRRHRQVALSQPAVPKSRLADMSTTSQVSSSGRRSSGARAGGWCGRSPTSPSGARRRRAGTAATPRFRTRPGIRPRWLPCSTPSSLRLTVSSSVRSAADSFGSPISPRWNDGGWTVSDWLTDRWHLPRREPPAAPNVLLRNGIHLRQRNGLQGCG